MNYPATPSSTSTFIHTQFQTATDWNLVPQIIWMAKYQQWPHHDHSICSPLGFECWLQFLGDFPNITRELQKLPKLQLRCPTKVSLQRCLPQSTEMSDSLMDMEGPRQLGQLALQSKPDGKARKLMTCMVFQWFFSHTCQNSVELSHENYPYPSWLIGFPTMGYDNLNKIR